MSSYDGAINGGESWANALTIAAFPGDTVVLEPPARSDRVFTLAAASASYIVIADSCWTHAMSATRA